MPDAVLPLKPVLRKIGYALGMWVKPPIGGVPQPDLRVFLLTHSQLCDELEQHCGHHLHEYSHAELSLFYDRLVTVGVPDAQLQPSEEGTMAETVTVKRACDVCHETMVPGARYTRLMRTTPFMQDGREVQYIAESHETMDVCAGCSDGLQVNYIFDTFKKEV